MDRPTSWRLLVAVAVIGVAVGWSLVALLDAAAGRLFPVPWMTPAVMGSSALALLGWTMSVRPRLQRKHGALPLPPIVAVRTAALALAASRVGAGVGGGYLGVALGLLPAWETPAGRASVIAAGLTVLGAIGLVAAGLWLESLCRLPPPADENAAPA